MRGLVLTLCAATAAAGTMRGLVLALCAATAAAGTETLFDLFGISQVELPGLDDTSLKKLYKRRALELHPDKSDHPDAAGRSRR